MFYLDDPDLMSLQMRMSRRVEPSPNWTKAFSCVPTKRGIDICTQKKVDK